MGSELVFWFEQTRKKRKKGMHEMEKQSKEETLPFRATEKRAKIFRRERPCSYLLQLV